MYKNITANPSLLKQLNRESIMRNVRECGELSRAMLARQLKISKPAISSLVDELISEGWLMESGSGDSTGGRKPVMLKINPGGGGLVGIIYNSYGLEMALMDFSGRTKVEEFIVVDDSLHGLDLLDEICRNINIFIETNICKTERVLGIGLGLPGAVRQADGLMIFTPVKGWQGLLIKKELESRLTYPVFVENDSNLMALGEHNSGVGRAIDDMIYINVGSGIGSGIIIDGRIFRGYHETAGEIGYLNFGCEGNAELGHGGIYEGNYSARTIRKRFDTDKKLRGLMHNFLEDNSSFLQQLRNLAETDERVRCFWEDVLCNWSNGVAAVASVLGPQLIVLGGEMVAAGEHGINFIRTLIKQRLPFSVDIKASVLGRKSGLIGAAYLVLESDRACMNLGKKTAYGE